MTDRRFGVELEFHITGIRGGLCDYVRQILREAGYHVWADQWVHTDGSGCEVPSPILKGEAGFAELKEVMDFLKSKGGVVSRSDGLHIHHDAPDFRGNKVAIGRLVDSWVNNKDNIGAFVAKSRHGSAVCRDLGTGGQYNMGEDSIEFIKENRPHSRYYSLNIRSLYDKGTVEFRWHQGTLNYDDAEAWIKFGQAFLNSVQQRKHPISCASSPDELVRRVRVHPSVRPTLEKKARRFERVAA